MTYTLQENPPRDQESWNFTVPPNELYPRRTGKNLGKFIKFTADAIKLDISPLPCNRILQEDDISNFILVSFADLRFPDSFLRVTAEYINRLMKAGLFLNGVQYRFYHHSNSQLRGRSCFLRKANSDAELDERIYKLGDFSKIMNVAKRAKRIGLLFSAAELDFRLDPSKVADISDMTFGDEVFSDGCGLMSRKLAIYVSKAKKVIFRGKRYTPCVFQISPIPQKHEEIFDHRKRYFFGSGLFKALFIRPNNDIIVLLSSLGITNEKLLAKQEQYFQWIESASHDVVGAIDFLSCLEKVEIAERVLLRGLDDPSVSRAIRSSQMGEVANFRKNDRPRTRMIIHKSRLIFGVCDPYKVLKEGQVHIRITSPRGGESTPINGDVLVVRNPCLHPGDCLKLRAVNHPMLSHLIDCIVFAAVARPGHHSAPSMSSGGDLDGDKYFVCWDPDLVPSHVAESYTYPPNKEQVSKGVTRADMANHFASYNAAGLAKVASLHQKWVKSSPKGALSPECQELNALHSQSVDGARIKIPDRLLTPPEANTPYIIDLLAGAATEFAERFMSAAQENIGGTTITREQSQELILQLLRSKQNAMSEFELFDLALKLARVHGISLRQYLPHLQFGALSSIEKCVVSTALGLTPQQDPYVWNSLVRSDILTPEDLEQRQLNKPFPLQQLYSSKISGLHNFFQYLRMATQDFTRKLIILKVDDRFSIGIFIRGEVLWDDDPEMNNSVVVCSFMPHASGPMSTYRLCTDGHRLHCSDNNFQLYHKNRADTFVFISRPPVASGAEVAVSIALQKISAKVQRQCGRVNRSPVTAIELHVVSNRDRVAHQLFDLYFEHVPTEQYIGRFDQEIVPYSLNQLSKVDWDNEKPEWLRELFVKKQSADTMKRQLFERTLEDLPKVMQFCIKYHADDELFWTFSVIAEKNPLPTTDVKTWIEKHPPLVFVLLKTYPPNESQVLPSQFEDLELVVIQNIIRSANDLGIATLVALEKITTSVAQIPTDLYLDLLMMAALCVRPQNLLQEILLVLNDFRASTIAESDTQAYVHKHALSVAFDRAEEAADECPCNERGKPRKGQSIFVRLFPVPDQPMQVIAHVRVDSSTAVRLHSHVRLQAASNPEKGWVDRAVLDAVVIQASRGEMKLELQYPLPPEFADMQWKMYNAGSVATSKAMMDAIVRLMQDGDECCMFHDIITDRQDGPVEEQEENDIDTTGLEEMEQKLNTSQMLAVKSAEAPLSLIWGPPGTGKTTVVIQILRVLLRSLPEDWKILMTASTHNAVDNVLERFVALNKQENLLQEEKIPRVSTDHSKVNKALQAYTVDARVGGDMNENNALVRKAQARVKAAVIVFTTCAGAGLGLLRKIDFDMVLIDEASQITEPCALIPLVKGCRKAVLVGDHVQLRPTVRPMAKALEYDVSLLERLYVGRARQNMRRTMLNVQYRFPKELAGFPSREFYQNKLQTDTHIDPTPLQVLNSSTFPWPRIAGAICPTTFVQCGTEEDMGGMSKSNEGQAQLVKHIVKMLTSPADEQGAAELSKLNITVLSPYSKQVKQLKTMLPSNVPCFTIDSFQGRESDIIIFSTVRCNADGDIGFVDDARRLNVMWTRARLALIIVGDYRTMTEGSQLWKRAIEACKPVAVALPEEGAS